MARGDMARQLSLNFRLRDAAVFERFAPGDNLQLLQTLKNPRRARLFVYGGRGVGKTHLLQACARNQKHGFYLPLSQVIPRIDEAFAALENFDPLCIDDIDLLAGDLSLEVGLFNLINRLHRTGHAFVLSAAAAPKHGGFVLPDLVSRLSACVAFRVAEPDDAQKRAYLVADARRRGMTLSAEAAQWIMNRTRRDMAAITALLGKLDAESLREQRRLTIPFLKTLL